MQTFQQYFYENKTILSHIMESRSGKWDIFIKFASSFEVLSFSIRFFAKFGRHFVSYLFGKPLAYRRRAAGIVGDESQQEVAGRWEGISSLNNFLYQGDCVTVWKAYDIGRGKTLSWSQLQDNHDNNSKYN